MRLYHKNPIKCYLIFIFILFLYFFPKPTSIDCSLSIDRLLDDCMLDETPCLPDITQSLDRYFHEIQTRYSMLLTYHPTIDCNQGRYLLLNNIRGSLIYHGTGSQLMWYLGVLNVAYALNLTLIHWTWTAEHADDESNQERDRYWQFADWEIPYAAYASCPKNSSIKRNIFRYDLLPQQTFEQHHQGKQSYTLMSSFKEKFDEFLSQLPNSSTGFTFYSSKTFTTTSSLMDVGVVFETRWWLQHRKLYNPINGVWSGLSIESNYKPKDYFQYFKLKPIDCPSIDIQRTLLIGIHIRHGDVVKRDQHGKIVSNTPNFYRFISHSAYIPLIISIISRLPVEIQHRYLITIYSEGIPEDFLDILVSLKRSLPSSSRCRISFFLNGRTSETFNRLLRDDVIISAHSTFSLSTGIFNSRQLKIGPVHNRARVHGMRNFLSLDIDHNHTKFDLTSEKLILIQRRIQYVWEQKHLQFNTSIPLWLDNYSRDYPEEFMLI